MSHPKIACLVTLLASVSPALAQSTAVLPARAGTSSEGNFSNSYWIWGATSGTNAAHVQALYASSEIPAAAANLNSLALCRTSYGPYPNPAATVVMTIALSQSSASVTAPSSTFASNVGAAPVQVWSGTVNLPARAAQAWPATWESPLAFGQPFAFSQAAGSTLVVDIATSQNSARAPWSAEVTTLGYGTLTHDVVQSLCVTSDGGPSGAYGYRQHEPYVGGVMSLSYLGMPSKLASYAASRFVFGFQGQGGSFLGKTLPFLLSDLGLSARPNCRWSIDWIADFPMNYIQGNSQNQGILTFGPVTLPNDPTLTGAVFFTQALAPDKDSATNAFQLFPTMSHKWQIGSGNTVPAAVVYRLQDSVPAGATGTAIASEAPALRVGY